MHTLLAIGPHLDFISGLAIGGAAGLLIGLVVAPAVPFMIAQREWEEASRQAELTDELLDEVSVLSGHLDASPLFESDEAYPTAPVAPPGTAMSDRLDEPA